MKNKFSIALLLVSFFLQSQNTNVSRIAVDQTIVPVDPIDSNYYGDVGAVKGNLSVSLTGAAIYSFPIQVPPGINNVVPKIILNYNSQAGNGIAGYGWNISGISIISRTGYRKDIDGYNAQVSNTIFDNYALDGQRLIYKSGQVGSQQGAIFETETYSNVKISAIGSSSNTQSVSPNYFLVEYPDGSKAYYGLITDNNSNSRNALDYAITYWENPQGIRINYEYINADNKLYISKIKYGSFGAETSINQVIFIYENKIKTESNYIGGLLVKNKFILKQINVYGIGDVQIRKYDITHELLATNEQKVTKITEVSNTSASNNNATIFEYENNNNQTDYSFYTTNASSPISQNNYSSLGETVNFGDFGDFNGDGKIDIIINKKICSLNDENIITELYTDQNNLKDYLCLNALDSNLKFSDKQYLSNIIVNGNDSTIKIYSLNMNNNQLNFEYERSYISGNYVKGDFNGDGLSDLIVQKSSNLNELQFVNLDRRLSNNYVKNISINLENYSIAYVSKAQGDFNGDGKTDLILFKEEQGYRKLKILTLDVDLNIRQLFNVSLNIVNPLTPQYGFYNSLKFADFNGDGKTDILDVDSKKILYSTGFTFIEEILPSSFNLTGNDNKTSNYLINDFNNDGKTDIIITRNNKQQVQVGTESYPCTFNIYGDPLTYCTRPIYAYTLTLKIDCFYRIGNDTNPWMETHTDYLNYTAPSTGIQDSYITPIPLLVNKNFNTGEFEILIYSDRWSGGRKFLRFANNNSSTKLNRIKTIVLNNGVKNHIEYVNIMKNNGIYSSNAILENYPNIDIQYNTGLYVTTKIEETFSGFYRKKLFKYHGLVYNTDGLGNLGFRSTMQTNWFVNETDAISNVTKFDITKRGVPIESFSVLGIVAPSITLSSTDPYISRTLIVYNNEDTTYVNPLLSNKVFKLHKSKIKDFDGLRNTTSTVTINVNVTNNPIQSIETIQNGSTMEQIKTTNFDYDSLTIPYMVDRLTSKNTTTTIFSPLDTTTSEELYTYNVNLLKEIKKRGHNTGYILEKNEYDTYGNIIKNTLSAPGLVDRVTNYEYDISHRFLTTKIDVEGLISKYSYNQVNGLLLTEILPSIEGFPLITTYMYDSWGKKIKKINYLGKIETYQYQNIESGTKITTIGEDGKNSVEFYDPIGRKTIESTKNIDGIFSTVVTYYDYNDKPILKSEPFLGDLEMTEMAVWSEMKYDVYGRLIQTNTLKNYDSEGKITSYSYNGLTTTEFDGQKYKLTTKNALDKIVLMTENPGGTINYLYYANGNLKSTSTSGVVITILQDGWGRKTELNDPSAGVYKYSYNDFDELIEEEVVAKGKTNYTFDNYGKIILKTVIGLGNDTTNTITTYNYNPSTKQLATVVFTDNTNNYTINNSYGYDNYKRVVQTIEERASNFKFQKDVTYDAFGRIEKTHFYAKDLTTNKLVDKWIKHTYKNGFNYQIYNMSNSTTLGNLLWQTNKVNAQGKILLAQMGNGININNTFDVFGFPSQFKHNKGTVNILTQTTTFDPVYGNLLSRDNNLFGIWNETLSYDSSDRLTSYKDIAGIQNQTYNENGTIASNNIGNYAYTINGKPYSVSTITPVDQSTTSTVLNYYTGRKQNITYNVSKNPVSITEQNKENIDFEYNNDNFRSVMYYGNLQVSKNLRSMRKFYAADGTMEIKRNTTNSINDFIIYIGGDGYSAPVVLKSDGITSNFFYLHRDYQETIIAVTNSSGVIVEKRMFDVWGSLIKYANNSGTTTVPIITTDLFIDRGYTGHEHLLGVGLINMNGRIYDNKLHKFLQPDNNIQDPYNTQNYNRYGYVMNNPTKYTDPTGEFWQYFFAALFNSYAAGVQASGGQLNPFNWGSTTWTNVALGAVSSLATQIATNSFNSYIDNYNNRKEINTFGNENNIEEHEYVDVTNYKLGKNSDNTFSNSNKEEFEIIAQMNIPYSIQQDNGFGNFDSSSTCGYDCKKSIDKYYYGKEIYNKEFYDMAKSGGVTIGNARDFLIKQGYKTTPLVRMNQDYKIAIRDFVNGINENKINFIGWEPHSISGSGWYHASLINSVEIGRITGTYRFGLMDPAGYVSYLYQKDFNLILMYFQVWK